MPTPVPVSEGDVQDLPPPPSVSGSANTAEQQYADHLAQRRPRTRMAAKRGFEEVDATANSSAAAPAAEPNEHRYRPGTIKNLNVMMRKRNQRVQRNSVIHGPTFNDDVMIRRFDKDASPSEHGGRAPGDARACSRHTVNGRQAAYGREDRRGKLVHGLGNPCCRRLLRARTRLARGRDGQANA